MVIHLSFSELSQTVRLSEDVLMEVIEHGILDPVSGADRDDWQFAGDIVTVLQKAVRLHQDLEINWQGIALVLELLEQRDELLLENTMLRQRLSRFVSE